MQEEHPRTTTNTPRSLFISFNNTGLNSEGGERGGRYRHAV